MNGEQITIGDVAELLAVPSRIVRDERYGTREAFALYTRPREAAPVAKATIQLSDAKRSSSENVKARR